MAMRATVVGTMCLATLSMCGIGGYAAVSATRTATANALTKDDAAAYRLTTWNTPAATAFADAYLRRCLTRYAPTKDGGTDPAEEARAAALTRMNATGEDPTCAAEGDAVARAVVSTAPTGMLDTIPGLDSGRYVYLTATTSDGITGTYSVPVTLDDPQQGTGPRVVGGIGITPEPALGSPTAQKSTRRPTDGALSQSLGSQFLPEYMAAWVASTQNLTQFVAADSSAAARTGLGGALTGVTVEKVTAYPISGAKSDALGTTYTYTDGATVETATVIAGKTPAGVQQRVAYRVMLTRIGDHWFVRDIRPGALGSLPNSQTAPAATPSLTPATTP